MEIRTHESLVAPPFRRGQWSQIAQFLMKKLPSHLATVNQYYSSPEPWILMSDGSKTSVLRTTVIITL